jgi:NAD(P)-dependent dehydrogenase (short-subunit alcohol dehydrogenase family)
MNSSLLNNRKALVTGGTSGIGKAIATSLASQGAEVIIVGRDPQKGQIAEQELRLLAGHERVRFIQADLSLISEARALPAKLGASLDFVVQSAGLIDPTDVRTAEGQNRMFVIDYLHRHVLSHGLKPLLEQSSDARMVMVAAGVPDSIFPDWKNMEGARIYKGFAVLPRLQAANLIMIQGLAKSWAPKIAVTAISPGLVDSEIFRDAPLWFRVIKPALKLLMTPAEVVAGLVSWLLTTPEARELNGFLMESPSKRHKRHALARPQEALDRLEKLTQEVLKSIP